MLRLTGVNIDKKLSLISTIFMFLSIFLLIVITCINSSFELSRYEVLNEFKLISENYLSETLQLIELVEVLFIILLVELELFQNTDNFDSYFVSMIGKKKFFYSKLFSYLIVILLYTTVIFIQFALIYLLRFRSIYHIKLILNCYFNYLIYFVLVFFITYIFVILFKNYFSAMIVFLYYWISKLIEERNQFLNILFPTIFLDFEVNSSYFETKTIYIIFYILILYFLSIKIYEFKDLKVVS